MSGFRGSHSRLLLFVLAMCGLLVPSAAERGALTAEAQQQLNAYARHVAWAESLVGTTIAQGKLEVLQFLPKRAHRALYHQVKASLQAVHASAQEHPLQRSDGASLLQVAIPPLFRAVYRGTGANGAMELLGEGNFGSVFKVKTLDTGVVYALKLVGYTKDKPMFSQGADQAAKAKVDDQTAAGFNSAWQLYREAVLSLRVGQQLPHIVKYERVLMADPTAPWDAQKYRLVSIHPSSHELQSADFYRGLVMEYCEGPNGMHTLEDARTSDVTDVDVQARARYLLDAFQGVHELHKVHRQHRDLKPDNVLICAGGAQFGGRQYVAKVADLGHERLDDKYHFKSAAEAFQAWNSRARVSLAPHGHVSVMAPEVIDVGYTTGLLDVYALGVTALCVLEGPAFEQCRDVQHRNSERVDKWKPEPKSAADLQAQITANIQDCTKTSLPSLNLPNVPAAERPRMTQLLARALACDPMKEGARLPIGTLVNGMKAIVDSLPAAVKQGAADVKQEVKQEAADVKQEVKQAPAHNQQVGFSGYVPFRSRPPNQAPPQ